MWIVSLISNTLFSKRRKNTSLIMTVAGIAVGVLSLTVVLGMMNGLQDVLIKNLIAVDAYDYTAKTDGGDEALTMLRIQSIADELTNTRGVDHAVPFIDEFALTQLGTTTRVLHIRAIDVSHAEYDTVFINALTAETWTPQQAPFIHQGTIRLGWKVALDMNADIGDVLTLTLPGEGTGFTPSVYQVIVSDFFYTGDSVYDATWAFMRLDDYMQAITPDTSTQSKSTPPTLPQVKIGIRSHDYAAITTLSSNSAKHPPLMNIHSWKKSNQSFYFALKTEKFLLITLVGIIFGIIILHFRFALLRRIHGKRDDIVALRAMGASPDHIRLWFFGESMCVGTLGVLIGVVGGIVFLATYPDILTFVKSILRMPLHPGEFTFGFVTAAQLVGIILCTEAMVFVTSFFSIRQAATIAPMQILRYE